MLATVSSKRHDKKICKKGSLTISVHLLELASKPVKKMQ